MILKHSVVLSAWLMLAGCNLVPARSGRAVTNQFENHASRGDEASAAIEGFQAAAKDCERALAALRAELNRQRATTNVLEGVGLGLLAAGVATSLPLALVGSAAGVFPAGSSAPADLLTGAGLVGMIGGGVGTALLGAALAFNYGIPERSATSYSRVARAYDAAWEVYDADVSVASEADADASAAAIGQIAAAAAGLRQVCGAP